MADEGLDHDDLVSIKRAVQELARVFLDRGISQGEVETIFCSAIAYAEDEHRKAEWARLDREANE